MVTAGRRIGRRIRGSVSAWLLFAAVALAPLPFGSAEPTAIAFWSAILGLALFVMPFGALRKPHFAVLGGVAVLVAAYSLVLHEQLALRPWLPGAEPDVLWSKASEALGTPLQPTLSIARHEPYFALGSPLICMLSFLCGLVVGADRHRARVLVWVLALSGVVYGLYGILAHLFDPAHVLWHDKAAYRDSLTATFINRNTAAAYFGSCAICCLMLFCDVIRHKLPHGAIEWRQIPGWLLFNPPRHAIMLVAMLFLCLIAMLMTNSRAGVAVSLGAIIVSFVLYFHRDLPRRNSILAALGGAVAAGLALLEFLGSGVSARFDAQGLADEGRLAVWQATMRMIRDHPWFGTGLGTFVWSFPAYRRADVSMAGMWDHAHNTLLELTAEMGIPLASLVVMGWILILVVLFRGALLRRRDQLIPIAAFGVAILSILHSMVDFSLQIAGYAIPVLTLVGAGVAQSFANPRSVERAGAAAHSASAAKPVAG